MNKLIVKWWKSYKYRFVPWIAMNLKQEPPSKTKPSDPHTKNKPIKRKSIPIHHLQKSKERLISDEELVQLLSNYFKKCEPFGAWSSLRSKDPKSVYEHNLQVMKSQFGFTVERCQSNLSPEAGTGVFVTSGSVKAGSVVALYCGTLYMPWDPLFFPSLGNKYIFRCADNIHIDGNDKFISKSIYKSSAARDKFDHLTPSCDTSWLTKYPINPLNVGQYVNNRTNTQDNNVIYQECTLTWGLTSNFVDESTERGSGGPWLSKPMSLGTSSLTNSNGRVRGDVGSSSISYAIKDMGDICFPTESTTSSMSLNDMASDLSLNSGHLGEAEKFLERGSYGFIPNVWFDPANVKRGLRVVPLVAIRDISTGEELLSSYFTIIHAEEKNASVQKDLSEK